MSKKDDLIKLKYWFEKLDILKWWNKKVEDLSKGMKPENTICYVTVIHNPDLLIFDEPFSGFDPLNTAIIRNEILELKKQGVSIIFSTHRMESVEEICDEITLINNGKSILQGEINSVKNNFKNNTFEFECNSENLVLDNFTDLKQYGNRYSVVIPEGKNSKDLINEILKHTDIHYFKEKIPSMEEIFIKTVNNNG